MMLLDGTTPKYGDVIRWHAEDRDNGNTWEFTGIIHKETVIYLGGGIDFGLAIGRQYTFAEVIAESENNDSWNKGIRKVGVAMDIVRLVKTLPSGETK